jgi:signal transduction histidine kinase
MERLRKLLDIEGPPAEGRALRVGYVSAIAIAAVLLGVGLAVYGRMREWYCLGFWRNWMETIPVVAMSYGTLLLLSAAIVESRVRHVHAAAWARRARELDDLVAALTARQEREYETLGTRLHDDIGTSLAAAKFEADAALSHASVDADARRRLLEALDRVIGEVRGLSSVLFPRMISQFGLRAGLDEIAERLRAGGLAVAIEIDPGIADVKGPLALLLARAVQEALVNARRHGGATRVRVRLARGGERIEGCIEDNGSGWPAGAADGVGLSLLRERLVRQGGTLTTGCAPGGGAQLCFVLPAGTGRAAE